MEKIACLVIGAALAVVLMTLLPADRVSTLMSGPPGDAAAAHEVQAQDPPAMSGMEAPHQHPPRDVSPDLPVPSLTHLIFQDAMDGYNLLIIPRNFTFTPAATNRAAQDNEGHAHVYVNGVKFARVYATWFHLPGATLRPGENDVTVTLNANDHSEWSDDGAVISSTVRVQRANTGQ